MGRGREGGREGENVRYDIELGFGRELRGEGREIEATRRSGEGKDCFG